MTDLTNFKWALALVLLFLSTGIANARQDRQSDQNTQGENEKWQGILDVKVAQLTLNFDLTRSPNGAWSGNIYSVEQGNAKIPISKMEISGNDVTIEARTVGAKFTGKLSDDGKTVTGKWKQGAGQHDFVIKRVDSFSEGEHVETWQGTLDAAGQKFDFGLRVFRREDGSWHGRLDSYNEAAMGLRATMDRDESRFNFEISVSKAVYEGTINDDGTITGFWIQAGGKFPLDFKKVKLDAGPISKRPQLPVEPFPYKQEQVKFENQTDNVVLSGTLTVPAGNGPWPAMVLISGSGPQDRDETLFDHKPFMVIADHLSRNGIAVLRFDDRGTAQSTGNFATATSEDFARDAEAGVTYLKTHDDIRGDQIGLIGHSEGGLIAPMIASHSPEIAMIVLLAGPGVDGSEITISQTRAIAEIANSPKDVIDASEILLTRILEKIREEHQPLESEFIEKVFAEAVATLENPELAPHLENAKAGLVLMESQWFRFFANYDPQTALRKVQCPVLALNGKKDLQVLADLNIDAIEKALTEAGNPDFELHKLENMNHLFQETDGTGSVIDYGRIEQTISPIALELMSDWIIERTK